MAKQYLTLDDVRLLNNAERIADTFERLGYTKVSERISVEDLDLSTRNAEAIYDAHLIADQGEGGLQVLLFELHGSEWETPSMASTRMKSIATQIGKRDTEFLLLATKDYDQLMLVNPRKTFDEKTNLRVSIRKLLIDRKNPTAYDRDRLESLAVNGQDPKTLYKTHCEEFDVEKLTKKFYEGYKKLFERVQQAVKDHNPDSYFEDPDRLHQFSQRLLGRIMFLYFLQKKEFLAGDRRFLDTQYRKQQYGQDDCDYYAEVLEPLFFDTLNKQRPNFDSQWGKIPYLNGGLFDRDYGPDIRDTAGKPTPETITLPNTLFNPGNTESILAYFNSYNFTISENVVGDEDIAVDPEMLGKVFENMLAAEERGKSGTFYTPRGIVQFMCSEVLARYLADETGMTLEETQKLIDYDPDVTDAEIKALISPQQAKSLRRAIEDIKVLDPAVGSGAFPLGMMQLLLNVRQAVARREGMTVQRGSLAISQWKRDIIANNLYGVDIKPEAIEIAKLRMWLSLVVDIPRIEDVEPLPNMDYKLMCGDSLISTIHEEQLIPDPTKEQQGMLAVTPIQMAVQPLLELQHRYFDAQSEERHELRKQILEAEANVFREAVKNQREAIIEEMRVTGKPDDKDYVGLAAKAKKAQTKKWNELQERLSKLDKFAQEVESGDRSLNFFQYHLHFRDVFEDKGGFDCIVGNPPYGFHQIHSEESKQYFKDNYESAKGSFENYFLFYECSLKILKQSGILGFITPITWMTIPSALSLRKFILTHCKIEEICWFSDKVFEQASVNTLISIIKNTFDIAQSKIRFYELLTDFPANPSDIKFLDTQSFIKNNYYIGIFEDFKENAILQRIIDISKPLVEYARPCSGYNPYEVGAGQSPDGGFQTKETVKTKPYHSDYKIGEEWKPEIVGKDLERYAVKFSGKRYVRYGEWLAAPRNPDNFLGKRILVQEITGGSSKRIVAAFYDDELYHSRDVIAVKITQDFPNYLYILALLNSKLITWYHHKRNPKSQKSLFPKILVSDLKQMPIKIPKLSNDNENNIYKTVIDLVSKIMNNKKQPSQDNLMLDKLDAEIDRLIYQLYDLTEEEIAIVEKSL